MLKKLFTIIATNLILMTGIAKAAVVNDDYIILKKPIAQLHKNKIEVLEFFGYNCVHCYHLEPFILKEIKSFAPDTYFRSVHVVWGDEEGKNLARIAAAVNSTGLKQRANPLIYDAMFIKKINLSDPKVFNQWAAKQTAFDGNKLIKAYNSLENRAETNKMQSLTENYKINGTPTVIVGGKYEVLFKNGFQAGMKTINELIEKVRKENKSQVTNMRKLPKSLGASLAGSSNR